MLDIASLTSEWSFWDWATAIGAVLGAAGLLLQFLREGRPISGIGPFTVHPTSARRDSLLKRTSRVLLIAGVIVPTVAQLKTSQITSLIIAFLNDQSKSHELKIEELRKENLASEQKNLELERRLKETEVKLRDAEAKIAATEARQGKTETKVANFSVKVSARDFDPDDLKLHTRKIRGALTTVTILLLPDPEAHQYGLKMFTALNRTPNMRTTTVDLKEDSFRTGIFVCENPAIPGAKQLSDALEISSIPNRYLRTRDKDWADVCGSGQSPTEWRPFASSGPRPGVTIFVGHNPQVVR